MEIFINGYSSIVKEIEKDSQNELNEYKKEIERKKEELEKEYFVLLETEKEKIGLTTKKITASTYKKTVSSAKVKFQNELLEKKEEVVNKIFQGLKVNLESLPSSKKVDFFSSKIEDVIKNAEDEIVEVQVPKDVKLKLDKKIKVVNDLDEFGFILVTSDGVMINQCYDILLGRNESELRKLISNTLF